MNQRRALSPHGISLCAAHSPALHSPSMTPGCCPAPDAPGPEGRDAEHCERHAHLQAPTVLHTAPRSSQRRMRKGFPQPCPAAMKPMASCRCLLCRLGWAHGCLRVAGRADTTAWRQFLNVMCPVRSPGQLGMAHGSPHSDSMPDLLGCQPPGPSWVGFCSPIFCCKVPLEPSQPHSTCSTQGV